MNKQTLKETFDSARQSESPFVFVVIVAEGTKEIITIPAESFDKKEAFYEKAYNNDLVHVMNSKVYIHGLSYGLASDLYFLV